MTSACVNVSRRQVVQALMVALVVVMPHKGRDVSLEIAGQEVILQQCAVLECLMPSLDLAPVFADDTVRPVCDMRLSSR